MKMLKKFILIFAITVSFFIVPAVVYAGLKTEPVVLKSKGWSVRSGKDAMTDEINCTGFYKNRFDIQVNKGVLYISLRGNVKGYKFRFDNEPPSEMRLASDMETSLSSIVIDGSDFEKLLSSKRFRVSGLSIFQSPIDEDIDLRGFGDIYKFITGAKCKSEQNTTPQPTKAVQNASASNMREQSPSARTPLLLIPFKDLTSLYKTLTGHSFVVHSVSFSPDGSNLASGSADNSIILWDVATGNKIKTLKGHSDSVHSISFSPDGKALASGSGDKNVILWDVATGDKIKTFLGHSNIVLSISFSPDNKTIASASEDKSVILWDVATGDKIMTLTGHSYGVYSAAFSPDGKTLASGGVDQKILLWDVATGNKIKTLKGHSDSVHSISFSPDGKALASGSRDKNVILWDVATGNKIKTLEGHSNNDVNSVAFSPDGKTLVSGGNDKNVILWDVATGNKIKTITHQSYAVNSVAFSPDNKTIASGSNDKDSVILLDTQLNEQLANITNPLEKDEFETALEYEARLEKYEARLRKIEVTFSSSLAFGRYDADRNGFEAEFKGNKIFVPVARDKARDISSRKGAMRIEGKLKYYDQENMALVEPNVIDGASNEKFEVYTMSAGSTPR